MPCTGRRSWRRPECRCPPTSSSTTTSPSTDARSASRSGTRSTRSSWSTDSVSTPSDGGWCGTWPGSGETDFSRDRLVERANADLANGFGNLASRVSTLVHRRLGGTVPVATASEPRGARTAGCWPPTRRLPAAVDEATRTVRPAASVRGPARRRRRGQPPSRHGATVDAVGRRASMPRGRAGRTPAARWPSSSLHSCPIWPSGCSTGSAVQGATVPTARAGLPRMVA